MVRDARHEPPAKVVQTSEVKKQASLFFHFQMRPTL